MTQPRFDMYTLVHKGQRRKLFEVTGAAGQLAEEDHAGRAALAAEVNAFLETLEEHAHHEDRFLGPLLQEAAPDVQARLHAEHGRLDEEISTLRPLVAEAVAAGTATKDLELYRALARLTSSYLAHVDVEESAMPALWARFDDAALAQVQGALVAAHQPMTVLFNLRTMLPAASPAERVRFLSGLRRSMPPPAFTHVRGLVEALVDAAEWQQIDAA